MPKACHYRTEGFYIVFIYSIVKFLLSLQAAQPPILIDNGVAVLENDLIERHIMKKIPGGHNLFVPDQVTSGPLKSYQEYLD